MISLKEIAEKLNTFSSFALFCHVRPDGDSLGSALALKLALNSLAKEADIFCCDEVPKKFFFISGAKDIKSKLEKKYNAYIALDCSDNLRLGAFGEKFSKEENTFCIDHHISNTSFAKTNFVRGMSSNCENVFELIEDLGVTLTKEIATPLLMGISTDTGNFSHKNTDENSFYIASKLVKVGADINEINFLMFRNQSKERAKLYGLVMSKIRFFLEDKVAVVSVLKGDIDKSGASPDMTEGFIDFAMDIESTEVAICILEVNEKSFKISFRSKKTDVNKIAATFGGGGHILASGCMLNGYYEDVIDKLVYACKQYIDD